MFDLCGDQFIWEQCRENVDFVRTATFKKPAGPRKEEEKKPAEVGLTNRPSKI